MHHTMSTRARRLMRVARRAALSASAPLMLAACHVGRRAEPPTVTIRVQNTLVPAVALTVSLLPSSGERRTVGVVGPSRTESLRVPLDASGDPHRLLAEAGSGPAIASRQFTLSTAATVEWNVGQNIVNVSERR